MQPDIPDLERGPLPDVNAHKVGGILVEYVDMAQPIEEQFPADGAREPGKEGHGSCEGIGWVAGSVDYRQLERLSLGEKRLHKWWSAVRSSPCESRGAPGAFTVSARLCRVVPAKSRPFTGRGCVNVGGSRGAV